MDNIKNDKEEQETYYWNSDISKWDESIYTWCQETGFNPFGCGPTPVFVVSEGKKKSTTDE